MQAPVIEYRSRDGERGARPLVQTILTITRLTTRAPAQPPEAPRAAHNQRQTPGGGAGGCAASRPSQTSFPEPWRPSREPRAHSPPSMALAPFVFLPRHQFSRTPHQVSTKVRSTSKGFGEERTKSLPSPSPNPPPHRKRVGQLRLCRRLRIAGSGHWMGNLTWVLTKTSTPD